jgi:hypothetical protein
MTNIISSSVLLQEAGSQFPRDSGMELNCSPIMPVSGGLHLANDEECTRGEEDGSGRKNSHDF